MAFDKYYRMKIKRAAEKILQRPLTDHMIVLILDESGKPHGFSHVIGLKECDALLNRAIDELWGDENHEISN